MVFTDFLILQMPRNYTRKLGAKARDIIPEDILKAAVDQVLVGGLLHATAKEYGLSRNTLRRYVRKVQSGQETRFSTSYLSSQVFSPEEEEEIAKYLDLMARMNHGLTIQLIDKLAYDLAVKNIQRIRTKRKKQATFRGEVFLTDTLNFH